MDGQKGPWRNFFKERLSSLSDEEKKNKSEKVSLALRNILLDLQLKQHQLHSPSCAKQVTLGGYAPLSNEVVWTLHLIEWQSSFSFPSLIDQKTMVFRQCEFSQLKPSSSFGLTLFCPPLDAPSIVPEILLIPGLGFSTKGVRLGRGKGYYDKYLEGYEGKKWGLCFEEQIAGELPYEDHDVAMEMIITDKNVYKISKYD